MVIWVRWRRAGGAGQCNNRISNAGGNGGAGLSYDITGSSQYYAGGGGAGAYLCWIMVALVDGGNGGDGVVHHGCQTMDLDGTANTGVGGGGGGN